MKLRFSPMALMTACPGKPWPIKVWPAGPTASRRPHRAVLAALLAASFLLLAAAPAWPVALSVSWDKPAEASVQTWRLYWGTTTGNYGSPVELAASRGDATLGADNRYHTRLAGFAPGRTYYVALRSVAEGGSLSALTPEVSVTTAADGDGDGMSDAWEQRYGLNPDDPADAFIDADGDGYTSLQEYGGAGDPTNSASRPLYAAVPPPQGSYSLSAAVNPAGGGSVSPGWASFAAGTSAALTATAATGWRFDHWGGDATGTNNPAVVVMSGNRSVTAYFTAITYTLTTSTSGSGTVGKNPSKAAYSPGERVTLTATPAAGWQFDHWGGDASGASSPLTLTMDASRSVTAYFVAAAARTHFPRMAAQPSWVDFQGSLSICGTPAEPGDEVAAFDARGAICGQFTVTASGYYGWLHAYGDDAATSQVEGAAPGDQLTFKVWDASAQQELVAHPVAVAGQPAPSWTLNGDRFQLDLECYCSQSVPLHAGWNLVSFAADTCYYATADPPAAPLLPGTRLARVSSVADALASIEGSFEAVRSFDEGGAHTFDPAMPDYINDLTYLAPGYGYWIKATRDCTLTLPGDSLPPQAALALHAGWNLVGCWADRVRYCGQPPQVPFAQAGPAPVFEEAASPEALFPGLSAGAYEVVRGFDEAGAHTFDPAMPDYINDLTYVGPGYGYWIKMKADGALRY